MLGQVTVTGYAVGDASNYNLNQDELEAAFSQMNPIDAPTASDATELNLANAQLSSGTSDNNSMLLTIGICIAALVLGVTIAK